MPPSTYSVPGGKGQTTSVMPRLCDSLKLSWQLRTLMEGSGDFWKGGWVHWESEFPSLLSSLHMDELSSVFSNRWRTHWWTSTFNLHFLLCFYSCSSGKPWFDSKNSQDQTWHYYRPGLMFVADNAAPPSIHLNPPLPFILLLLWYFHCCCNNPVVVPRYYSLDFACTKCTMSVHLVCTSYFWSELI